MADQELSVIDNVHSNLLLDITFTDLNLIKYNNMNYIFNSNYFSMYKYICKVCYIS